MLSTRRFVCRNRITGVSVGLCLPWLSGCWRPAAPSPCELERGLVWFFPGVGGGNYLIERPYRALRDGGVGSAIRVHAWWRPFGTLLNLCSYRDNRAAAAKIAADITAYAREFPGRPIDLLGYSGGGGMAIMTAEALPENVRVRNVVLVHPAISARYDLTETLRRVDGRLVNFYSRLDWWTLGLGTSLFGTMDRKFTCSAGMCGLDLSRAVPDEALRTRVVQDSWGRDDLAQLHLGGHPGILGYRWNRAFVAPLLRSGLEDAPPDE
jgi:pimeloyl-ACP methyl ester carboxylesterase